MVGWGQAQESLFRKNTPTLVPAAHTHIHLTTYITMLTWMELL